MGAILNQPWEDVADDVTGAIEKAVQPLLKKAVDDIYGGLLDATQDYLKDNLAFNIASRISTAEQEASNCRREIEREREITAELLSACIHAAAQFRYYEQLHLAKGTTAGDEKAHGNHELATRMEAAIAKARGEA
jgi:hypothetical protein